MKRRLSLLVLLTLLLALALLTVCQTAGLPYVTDDAGILTDAERSKLEERARTVSERYQCGVYIATVRNYRDYQPSPPETTEWIYDTYELGLGTGHDGIILLLSMADRDYDIYYSPGVRDTVFTQYGQEKLVEHLLDDLRDDRWADGFFDYLKDCEKYLSMAEKGKPFDQSSDPMRVLRILPLTGAVSLIIALIVCMVAKRGMRSVFKGDDAKAYIVADSGRLRVCEDQFTHSTEVRRIIESDSGGSSRSGGGGGHASSHSTGKF